MGNNQQKLSTANKSKMKSSVSMTTTKTFNNNDLNNSKVPQSATINIIPNYSIKLIDEQTQNIHPEIDSSSLSTDSSKKQKNKFDTSQTSCKFSVIKCFKNKNQHHHNQAEIRGTNHYPNKISNNSNNEASLSKRLLSKVRKSMLKTSSTHNDNINSLSKSNANTLQQGIAHRSTTDQNLLVIKDTCENTFNDEMDMIDLLNEEQCENDLTIDSKFLRDVNKKLKSIQDHDDDDTENDEEEAYEINTNNQNFKAMPKSPALFNINLYANNEAGNVKTKDVVAREKQINDSDEDEYEDSSSQSISYNSENFEDYQKRHGFKLTKPDKISISSTSSLTSMSSLSSFSSSSICMQQNEPIITNQETKKSTEANNTTKNLNLRLKNIFPMIKCKLNRKSAKLTDKETDELITEKINEKQKTHSELYSFQERFEIKDNLLESESLCFIDEVSTSSSVSLPSNQSSSKLSPRNEENANEPFNFLHEVNKKLLVYHQKKQIKAKKNLKTQRDLLINNKPKLQSNTIHTVHHIHHHHHHHHQKERNLDSVSNSINNYFNRNRMYDDRIIDKIINKENEYDFNDNNNEMEFIYNLNRKPFSRFKNREVNDFPQALNDNSSIAHIKVNAPLALSEHTTPLSRSIDYLNHLEIRNRNANIPNKKYYRFSNLSTYNSTN